MARTTWTITVRHLESGKARVITGSDKFIVEEKARIQQAAWEQAWQNTLAKQQEQQEKRAAQQARQQQAAQAKETAAAYKEERASEAAEQSEAAQQAINAIQSLLAHTLDVDDVVDWSSLKQQAPFSIPRPEAISIPKPEPLPTKRKPQRDDPTFNTSPATPPGLKERPRKPYWAEKRFQPQLNVIKRVLTPGKVRERMARAACDAALKEWEAECKHIEQHNFQLLAAQQAQHQAAMHTLFDEALAQWQSYTDDAEQRNTNQREAYEVRQQMATENHSKALANWEQARATHQSEQAAHNSKIDAHRQAYERLDEDAVPDYFDLVLSASVYPENFSREWDMQYQADSKMLVVDYRLPSLEVMPRLKEVRYLVSKDEFRETLLRDSEANALYDAALYQIALRTLHELFESDYAEALDTVTFNGIVESIDKATGKAESACVMSLQAGREEFTSIDLSNVVPKACFKALKGVGSSKLHSLTPVPPIVRLDTADVRFVQAYGVADGLDETNNLATMDWEDFEHLVREVFEKEFSGTGGEVKVTRASRDGGVDAVAFDPDPIRGGKIVIQAKRYSNTVGVSAVRDLYGTVMNEGAIKGILVSTANYGPDAYEFANGKPLALLNGANLLHLLAKHGHRASIDLQAARQRN